MGERDPWFDRMRARFRLEHGLLLGGAFMLVGLVMGARDRRRPGSRTASARSPTNASRWSPPRCSSSASRSSSPRSCCRFSVCAGAERGPPRGGCRRSSSRATAACGARRAVAAVPLLALTAFYCLRPRFYYTGTDSVEDAARTSSKRRPARPSACPGLRLPARHGRRAPAGALAHARSDRRCSSALAPAGSTIARAAAARRACGRTDRATPTSRSRRRRRSRPRARPRCA